MAISFNQVANPNFSDSNRLLEIALAQSAKAAEGLQGTVNTAVQNVEDANLAKVRQLVDSQTREQLQDPIHQQLMQKQIADMVAPTGGTYDPLKVAEYQDKRVNNLLARETSQSNLDGAAVTRKAGQLRNDHDAVMNPYLQSAAKRKEATEEEAFVANKLSLDLDYFNKQGETLNRAIAATTDEATLADLKQRQALLEQDRLNTLGSYGDIAPRIYSLAFEALEAKDAEEEKRLLQNLDAKSVIQARASNSANQTQRTANDTARTDSTILNDAARTRLEELKASNKANDNSAQVKEAKTIMKEYGFSPTTINSDGTVNHRSMANQTRNKANDAANKAEKGDNMPYPDFVISIKDNKLSNNQMEDVDEVMRRKNLPDSQKVAYMKFLQMNPARADNWLGFSSKSAIEKDLDKFLATHTTTDAMRRRGEAYAAEYQKTINALTDLNESPSDIVKNLGLTLDFEGIEYLPQEIKDELGFDLAKYRAKQARKVATANNTHTEQAKKDFEEHNAKWARENSKAVKESNQLWGMPKY